MSSTVQTEKAQTNTADEPMRDVFDPEMTRELHGKTVAYLQQQVPTTMEEAEEHAWSAPLDEIDVAHPVLFKNNCFWPYFERLRKEDPVHYCPNSGVNGPHWSITKYKDIMEIDTNHKQFSSDSEYGGILIGERPKEVELPMFIAMDPPKHDVQRRTVVPAVAPDNIAKLAPIVRKRAGDILDSLPIGEEFDWVDKVSKELTAMTLATLFDFPYEQRRKLTFWSDLVLSPPGIGGLVETLEEKQAHMNECSTAFMNLWGERLNSEPKIDLISMLAHGEDTHNMSPIELFGNVILLIIGGNDTTRNTISGSLYALNKNPDQYNKLRSNPALIPNMVSETIRWQTPLAHMRRTAVEDVTFRGKHIKKGDQVVMWYVSGNYDDEVIEDPYRYNIERKNPRQHISFGYGIHRCVGNRVAEMQLNIIWEEILKRFSDINLIQEPDRTLSNFVRGYTKMPVIIPSRL